jgi:hypothetical protein
MRGVALAAVVFSFACVPQLAFACSRKAPVSTNDMIRGADAIFRARAVDYAKRPVAPWTTGQPDSRVRFKVVEVIRGPRLDDLELPGYLSDEDDFNDHESPYKFVRPGGRAGTCFANTYRSGAEFLLVLKRTPDGGFTVNWYALGPVNEQLRSDHDAWLVWVRLEAKKAKLPDIHLAPTRASAEMPHPTTGG